MADRVRPNVEFQHRAVVYNEIDHMIDVVIPFVQHALAAGEPVLVQVPEQTRGVVDELVGDLGPHVDLLGDLYGHPHQALWGLRQFLDEEGASDRGVRVVSQVDYNTSPWISSEWGRVEALFNALLRDVPLSMVCLFDVSTVDADVLAQARATHPEVSYDGDLAPSRQYEPPETYMASRDTGWATDPLEASPAAAVVDLTTVEDIRAVRTELDLHLASTGLPKDRKEDFRSAVFEVTANALLYGGESAHVALWRAGDRVLCRVRDSGPGLPDPLTGYLPPTSRDGAGGRGLWVARQLSDHMTTTSEPPGFTVRLSVEV